MFTHLHVHSVFSFLDGASQVTNLVERVKELGMTSLAITDHDNVSSAVRFIKAARSAGIKPIIGCEVTMEGGYHLTLLCKNNAGYRELCNILTNAHLTNERGNPKVDLDVLATHKEGLFVLSGCRKGLIPSLILQKRFKEARDVAESYKGIFGKDAFFIEISESLLPGSTGLNRTLSELAESLNLHSVVTNNVHYAEKEDFQIHDILTCIRTLTTLEEVHPERRLNAENYLKSEACMRMEHKDYAEALNMTCFIEEQCDCPIELGVSNFPAFDYPEGFESTNQFLYYLVSEGARQRYGKMTSDVKTRLGYELSVIEQLGYADYFLVVWDLVRFAASKGIRYAGRGSAADSAVAYCLGISDVDPIAQNLLFERFMSLERGEKPDIDIDFDARRRDEVTAYVYGKYGEGHVASVATYNTFQGRSSIRDVGKVMGYSPSEIDLIAKRLPYIPGRMLEHALESLPELKGLEIPKKRLRVLVESAVKLHDFPRHLGTHLGGVVISRNPITWLSPLELSAKGVKILQFDKDDVEDLGLVKIDLLSLRTLGAIEDSLKFAKTASEPDYDAIPLDDPDTFNRLKSADTVGIFQLESPAQRGLQARLDADNIEDVVASVALIRPGPIKGNMVEPFIRRRKGEEEITYLEPRLESILKKTYGVVLFQEQVIEIASEIAGFTPGEADNLRRIMTHGRSTEEMNKIGEVFIEKAQKNGVIEETAREIFECMKGYASYGFCEAHARAFATTAYKTAYLIEHYPAEFYGAILNNQPMGFYPVSTICVEAKRHGVNVLGPSVNCSGIEVSVRGMAIRIPFKMIKGMTRSTMESMVCEREEGGVFSSFADFVKRVKIDKDILRNLILCGAFDEFEVSRRMLLWQSNDLKPSNRDENQISLLEPIYDKCSSFLESEFSIKEKVFYEYEVLGFGVSAHPMEICRDRLKDKGFASSDELCRYSPGSFVKVGGIPIRPHRPPTKSGRTVVFLSLEDEHGLIDVTCFENVYKKHAKLLFPGETLPLGIWGQVQKRGNAVSVIARTVFPLSYVLTSGSKK